jgi:hypothetical protein
MPKPPQIKSRSQDLRIQLNEALISVFRLEERDYFQDLSFAQLLKLKQGLARIHDTVTLRLTFGLVNWISGRFNFTPNQKAALWKQVDDQSANSSGFDLSWHDPRIIAEVKGCIPVNGGHVFGAAQVKGLTNDVRQMFGLPAIGKTRAQLSPRSKVHHPTNPNAIKLLALYDSLEVRKATLHWKQRLEGQGWFKALTPPCSIQDVPDNDQPNDPTILYIIYLTHSGENRLSPKA